MSKQIMNAGNCILEFTESGSEVTAKAVKGAPRLVIPESYNGKPVRCLCGDGFSFEGSELVREVILPEGLVTLGYFALAGLSALEKITLPESLKEVTKSCFYGCHSLKVITFPRGVKLIDSDTLGDCPSIENIFVDGENERYCSIGGNLYSGDGRKLIIYAYGKPDRRLDIPSGVTEIGEYAFAGVRHLESVTVPKSVSLIGEGAFNNCQSLVSINVSSDNPYYSSLDGVLYNKLGDELISYPMAKPDDEFYVPGGVRVIGPSAFSLASKLVRLILPDSVTNLEYWACQGCSALEYVKLPRGVIYLGEGAFMDCDNLPCIFIPDTVLTVDDFVFSNCPMLTVYCEAQEIPDGWDTCWNPDELPVVFGETED